MLIYDVILDVGSTGVQQTVSLYQGDDRSKMLRITLLQNGRAYSVASDMTVRLHGVKPDDSLLSPLCGVRGGSVYYLPAANATDTQGTVLCQLQVRDHSGAILFTPEFSMQIVASLPVPELPDGASEDVEYNEEVLSALSASADGAILLFHGEPVGSVWSMAELPETAPEDTIVYLIGDGLYRFADDEWTQLTADDLLASASEPQDAHTHTNKSVLDALTASAGKLRYDGKAVGIEMVNDLPAEVENGTIVYRYASTAPGLYVYRNYNWTQITRDSDTFMMVYLSSVAHSHSNKSVLDTVTENVVSSAHTHSNKTTLDKLTDPDGKLLYNGSEIGGVQVVASPNALNANASNGSIAVAVADGLHLTPITLPAQTSNEEVEMEIGDVDVAIGTPTYNAYAIHAAILAQDIETDGYISLDDDIELGMWIMPVVSDLTDNDYADAGIELDEGEVMLAEDSTTNYVIFLDLGTSDYALVPPARIVQVDATHVTKPMQAIYAFEAMDFSVGDAIEAHLSAGWNIMCATYVTGADEDDWDELSFVNNVDINQYLRMQTTEDSTIFVNRTGASQIFSGLFALKSTLPKGLYVKTGTWKRLAEA